MLLHTHTKKKSHTISDLTLKVNLLHRFDASMAREQKRRTGGQAGREGDVRKSRETGMVKQGQKKNTRREERKK